MFDRVMSKTDVDVRHHGAPRSYLYVPADQARLLRSAARSSADAVILDLEDGVAPRQKDAARAAALQFLSDNASSRAVWVRINTGRRGAEDAAAVLSQGLGSGGIWVPKAEPSRALDELVALVAEVAPQVPLGLLIESARGVVTLGQTCATPGVDRLQLGEVDLRADLGMPASYDDGLLDWARGLVVAHAASARLRCAVAPVSVELTDMASFRALTVRLREFGFRGRACIHPRQVDVANDIFEVRAEDLAAAHALLDLFEAQLDRGHGAFRDSEGAMADAATVRRAREITGRAPGVVRSETVGEAR